MVSSFLTYWHESRIHLSPPSCALHTSPIPFPFIVSHQYSSTRYTNDNLTEKHITLVWPTGLARNCPFKILKLRFRSLLISYQLHRLKSLGMRTGRSRCNNECLKLIPLRTGADKGCGTQSSMTFDCQYLDRTTISAVRSTSNLCTLPMHPHPLH